jgi:hypothetical protein
MYKRKQQTSLNEERRSGKYDRGPVYGIALDGCECFIRLCKREGCHLRPELNICRNLQKVSGILPRHVSYATDLPFSPKQAIIIELGHAVEVNRIDRNDSALPQTTESRDDDISAGCKRNCTIE